MSIIFLNLIGMYWNIIRECGSTLLCRVATCVPPTNTKFEPFLLLTQVGIPYTNTYKAQNIIFQLYTPFLGIGKRWKSISAARQKPEILAFSSSSIAIIIIIIIIIILFNFKIFFFPINSDEISPRSVYKTYITIGSYIYFPEVCAFGTLVTSTEVFRLKIIRPRPLTILTSSLLFIPN